MNTTLNNRDITRSLNHIPHDDFYRRAVNYIAQWFNVDCVVIAGFEDADVLSVKSAYYLNLTAEEIDYHIDKTDIKRIMSGEIINSHHSDKTPRSTLSVNGDCFSAVFVVPIVTVKHQVIGHLALLHQGYNSDITKHLSVLNTVLLSISRVLDNRPNPPPMSSVIGAQITPETRDYFNELVKLMTRCFNVDYAFVGHTSSDPLEHIDMIAMAHDQVLMDGWQCSLPALSGAPSINSPSILHLRPAKVKFTRDRDEQVINARCIIAICLFNEHQQVIAMLGIMALKELNNIDEIRSFLEVYVGNPPRGFNSQWAYQSADDYRHVLSSTAYLLGVTDRCYRYIALNQAYRDLLGIDINPPLIHSVADVYGHKSCEKLIRPSLKQSPKGQSDSVECVLTDKSGNDIYIHSTHHPYYDKGCNIAGVVMSGHDITDIKHRETTNTKERAWLQLLYDETPSMLFSIDPDYCISAANGFVKKKLGYEIASLIKAKMHTMYLLEDRDNIEQLLRRCFEHPKLLHEWEMRQLRYDNQVIWVKQSAQVVQCRHHGMHILLASEDITATYERALELSYQASHDALTGLYNRLEFEHKLNKLIGASAKKNRLEHVLCYIDLDNFKVINDACGHAAGDAFLQNIAKILMNEVRRNDVICRIGGDEFTILMENCSLPKGLEIAEKIRYVIELYDFIWQGTSFNVTASIGVSTFGLTNQSLVELVSCADDACYLAKESGRNCVKSHIQSPRVLSACEQRNKALKQAICHEKFELYAQPTFKITDMTKVVSYEFLLRMRYEDELLTASEFMSVAQRSDLLLVIDRWVIDNVFRWIHVNIHFLVGIRCHINLSTTALTDEKFLNYVLKQLSQFQIDGSYIAFEITELSALENLQAVVNFMAKMMQYNVCFILDNFGGDNSLFAHIKSLPVELVKIDGQLISDNMDKAVNLATIRAINDIAHIVDKATVATFVEDEEILYRLKEIGVDYVQGDLLGIAKPLSLIF